LHFLPWPYSDHISIFKFTNTISLTAMKIGIYYVVFGCVPVYYCIVILVNPIITTICFASDRGRNVIQSRSTASKFPRRLHIRNIYSIFRSAGCEWNWISSRNITAIICCNTSSKTNCGNKKYKVKILTVRKCTFEIQLYLAHLKGTITPFVLTV